jgi:hypothetical protein
MPTLTASLAARLLSITSLEHLGGCARALPQHVLPVADIMTRPILIER